MGWQRQLQTFGWFRDRGLDLIYPPQCASCGRRRAPDGAGSAPPAASNSSIGNRPVRSRARTLAGCHCDGGSNLALHPLSALQCTKHLRFQAAVRLAPYDGHAADRNLRLKQRERSGLGNGRWPISWLTSAASDCRRWLSTSLCRCRCIGRGERGAASTTRSMLAQTIGERSPFPCTAFASYAATDAAAGWTHQQWSPGERPRSVPGAVAPRSARIACLAGRRRDDDRRHGWRSRTRVLREGGAAAGGGDRGFVAAPKGWARLIRAGQIKPLVALSQAGHCRTMVGSPCCPVFSDDYACPHVSTSASVLESAR